MVSTWLLYNPLTSKEEVYNQDSTEHWITSESIDVLNTELRDITISRPRHRDNGEENGKRLLCSHVIYIFVVYVYVHGRRIRRLEEEYSIQINFVKIICVILLKASLQVNFERYGRRIRRLEVEYFIQETL